MFALKRRAFLNVSQFHVITTILAFGTTFRRPSCAALIPFHSQRGGQVARLPILPMGLCKESEVALAALRERLPDWGSTAKGLRPAKALLARQQGS